MPRVMHRAMQNLNLEELLKYRDVILPIATGVLLGLVILIVGWIASKWANAFVLKASRKAKLDEALARFLGSIAQYTVLAAAVISALGRVGVQTTSLVAVFASAGLAVGLAMQGSLSSFASGVMILFFRPFTLEDVVKISGEVGVVKDVGLFATTLQTPDNHTIIVPNSQVTSGNITNFTRVGTRRAKIDIGVAYGADLQKASDVLLKAITGMDAVLKDPAPSVVLAGFGASSVDFNVYYFANIADWWVSQTEAKKRIYDALNAAGIEIPFNQIVVHNAA